MSSWRPLHPPLEKGDLHLEERDCQTIFFGELPSLMMTRKQSKEDLAAAQSISYIKMFLLPGRM